MSLNIDIVTISQIIGFLGILIGMIIVGWILARLFKAGARKAGVPETEAALVTTVLKYSIYLIGVIEALTYSGISFIPFLMVIALITLIIGISARAILENIISGYVLRIQKPFIVGETVKLGDRIGTIKDLDLLYTTIKTDFLQCYTIPNSVVINSEMFNLTRQQCSFPVELEFTVPFRLGIEKTKKAILKMLDQYSNLNKEMPISLLATSMTDKGILLKVRFYVLKHEMKEGAGDFIITRITKMLNQKNEALTRNSGTLKSKGNTIPQKTESMEPIGLIKCPMCDSTEWTGYLRCTKCSGYYLQGKCLKSDYLRRGKCPIDNGKFEFIPEDRDSEGEKD